MCIINRRLVPTTHTAMGTYTAGDIIEFKIHDSTFYGEVLGMDDKGKVEVSRLQQTNKQDGRIWQFVDDNKWSAIDDTYITKHVQVADHADRDTLVKAWNTVGFIPGGDGITFCRTSDEDRVTLPLYEGAEALSDDEDDEDTASSNPKMHGYASDGFVVPDDEGSEFEFADPDELDEEAAQFVRETHEAVHEYDNWKPTDKKGQAIKAFIDKMDQKAAIDTDNQRLSKGKPALSTSKPPLKKRKRK